MFEKAEPIKKFARTYVHDYEEIILPNPCGNRGAHACCRRRLDNNFNRQTFPSYLVWECWAKR